MRSIRRYPRHLQGEAVVEQSGYGATDDGDTMNRLAIRDGYAELVSSHRLMVPMVLPNESVRLSQLARDYGQPCVFHFFDAIPVGALQLRRAFCKPLQKEATP